MSAGTTAALSAVLTPAAILSALACVAAAGALLEIAGRIPAWRRAHRASAHRSAPDAPADARWARSRGADARVERLLDAAGRAGGIADAKQLADRARTTSLLGAAWAAALTLLAAGAPMVLLAAPLGWLAGARLPLVLVARAGRAREERLRDEAPEVLALLAAGSACGLPLEPLLALPGTWLSGDLATGCSLAARDLRRGAAPDHVLAALEREYPGADVAAAVAILTRARVHGVAAAPALGALAAGARAGRARRAGDRAARAAPRIQLVAALLLVPAALCMLAAALVGGAA